MRSALIITVLLFLPLAASCQVVGTSTSPPSVETGTTNIVTKNVASPVSVSVDKAAISGQVYTVASGRTPLGDVTVRAGRIHWNSDKSDGAFVFEGASGPSAVTQPDGSFTIPNVGPGDYAIMVGDPTARYEIIAAGDGKARVYSAEAGKHLNVGVLEVKNVP